jgi:phosphoglycolate/pyridoxal phosphate phosphatase family enzyme
MKTYVFDMDGVLFRMEDPLPGAAETITLLRNKGCKIYFLTNNSSKSRKDYQEKLARFVIHAEMNEIITSAWATGRYFIERNEIGKRVYVVGEGGLREELLAVGMRVTPFREDLHFDYVVVGWDRQLTYQKMVEAHRAICDGAIFIATNRDSTYPDSDGRTLPGNGAAVAAIETCSGITPITIGKPEPYTLELILRLSNTPPRECMIIGDRLDTDVAIGKKVGVRTGMTLTGVSSKVDIDNAPTDMRPDHIWGDLREFAEELTK